MAHVDYAVRKEMLECTFFFFTPLIFPSELQLRSPVNGLFPKLPLT